jgi:pyruvate,water dikinase
LALYHYNKLKSQSLKRKIDKITIEHKDKKEHFVKEMAEGIAQIAAAFYPKPVIVRLSDLKTNEYETLIGGELFEPKEENPMLGWRGASRYCDKDFQPAFEMECKALKRVRQVFGLKNIWIMVPFCRTVKEGKNVLGLMAKYGLKKGKDGLKVIVMCEIPSNVVLIDDFLKIFDGVSIGSNDLTQLALGIDRDNSQIAYISDERDETVKKMISKVIRACNAKNKYCGICGQAPSDFTEFAQFLIKEKIESISLNPDTVIKTILKLSKKNV